VNVVLTQTIPGTTACAGTSDYFDSTSLSCETCSTNYVKVNNGMNCECPNFFLLTGLTEPQTCDSTTCTTAQRANLIQSTCTACTTALCACANNTFLSEYELTSGGTIELGCVNCPTGYFSTSNVELAYNCTVCAAVGQIAGADGVCTCSVTGEELQSTF
jgi:hypothetical protein